MHFEFATSTRIAFGPGRVEELPSAVKSLGKRALLVVGQSGQRPAGSIEHLRSEGVFVSEFHGTGEPTLATVRSGLWQAQADRCDLVVGLGGGSVLDTGKAIAALMCNPGDIYDYLEVVGKGRPLASPSAPYIAVPTTAGSGSEVTRNSVLAVTDQRIKVSLRSPFLLPRLAIVDPELTYGLPPSQTATSGLDALTQLIEPFLSNASNPITDAVCREGMRRVARSLRRACEHGDDTEAREDMSLGSLMGGLALANAKLGAVHGFAGPIGGMFPAPHGGICARLLPVVLEINLRALREREAVAPALVRFSDLGHLLTANLNARPEDGIRWLRELCEFLHIPALSTYGVTQADFPEIIEQAKRASSMKGNPVELTDDELTRIMEFAV